MAEEKSLSLLQRVRLGGPSRDDIKAAALLALVIFVANLLGVALRPVGLLAAASPAHALLLGLMVRFPRLAMPVGWIAAVAAYLAADLLTGNTLLNTLVLTSASLSGVLLGYRLLQQQSDDVRTLTGPSAVLRLLLVLTAASAMAGLVGTLAHMVKMGVLWPTAWLYWFMSELVSYLALVPVVLTLPEPDLLRRGDLRRGLALARIDTLSLLPALAFVLACGAGLVIGGPAAIGLPFAALIWCALTYGVFSVAVLVLLCVIWMCLGMALELFPGWPGAQEVSYHLTGRLGVALLGLGPLALAGLMAAHRALRVRCDLLMSHDALSGLFSRYAFAERVQRELAIARAARAPVALLMLDIDHFKHINRIYGQAAGDRAIVMLAQVMREVLGGTGIMGRLGGEEFAVLMRGGTLAEVMAAADGLRLAFAATRLDLGEGQEVEATLSIGLAWALTAPSTTEPLLQVADEALSLAKGGGRNRVVRRDLSPAGA